MRIGPRALLGRGLCIALALAISATASGSGSMAASGPVASVAKKKCKGKHRHKGHRKHCRKKGGGGGDTGGSPGGGDGGGGSQAPCAGTATSPGHAAAYESEYSITLSRASVGCGTVILQQDTTHAMDPHDLVLQREGDPAPSFGYSQLDPGLTASQTLNLSRGTWVLYCDILDHRARGMEVRLTVN